MVDLWPFAYGREYYKHIMTGLFGSSSLPNHCIYLSVTAHPGAVLACHDAKMEAHVVLDRVRQHSKAHGSALLRETLVREYYVHERARLAVASTKRWLSNELSFVEVSAPSGQYGSLLFEDVSKSDSTPSWRATVDEAHRRQTSNLQCPS